MGSQRPFISACLIARDEEEFIGQCLESLRGVVDEIIVVDTGSTDRTPDIARHYGARVISRAWPDDFAVARNWALAEANGEWLFVLDADEELVSEDAPKLRKLAASGLADGYLVNVHHFPDDEERHVITQHVALFRNDPRFRYKGAIHEQVGSQIAEAGGRLSATDIRVIHKGYEASVVAAKRKHERNLSMLQREADRHPDEPVWHYYLGQEYYGLGRLDEAARAYDKAFALAGPEWSSRYAVPGVIRYSLALGGLERWDRAFDLLERYRRLYPKSSDLHYLQATLALRVGDLAWAIGLLAQAIAYGEPPPGMFEFTSRGTGSYKAWYEMGQAYERLHQRDKAAGAYLEAVRAEPKYARAIKALTMLFLETDPPERVVAFVLNRVSARELRPIDAIWEALVNAGAYQQALDILDQLDARHESERALRQGITHLALGNVDAALRRLEVALEGEKTRDTAAMDGVLAAVGAREVALGRHFLEQVNPQKFPAATELLGELIEALSRDERADSRKVGKPHELHGERNHSGARGGTAGVGPWWPSAGVNVVGVQAAGWHLIQRAVAFRQFEVVDWLVQTLVGRGLPASEAALALGKILHAHGYQEAGLDLLLQATRQGRYDVEALMTLARTALNRRDHEVAEALLRKAVEVAGKHPAPVMALAAFLAETGRVQGALAVLEDAIRANPYAGILREHRERLTRGSLAP